MAINYCIFNWSNIANTDVSGTPETEPIMVWYLRCFLVLTARLKNIVFTTGFWANNQWETPWLPQFWACCSCSAFQRRQVAATNKNTVNYHDLAASCPAVSNTSQNCWFEPTYDRVRFWWTRCVALWPLQKLTPTLLHAARFLMLFWGRRALVSYQFPIWHCWL